ncbi:hypothetical protein BJV78DRAFT_1081854, partial [Lactifluus subvellereus]
KKREPLPPGPQGWPILGNLLQDPQRRHWLKYDEWTRRYGDVVRITSFGETTIILGSAQAASDLLDTEDDVYRGMFIEKGATVYKLNLTWQLGCRGILHDEKTYPSPFRFHPTRFLDANGNLKTLTRTEDPGFVAFGFGRRYCPPNCNAENSVFLYVASVLYIFDICKAKDAPGRDIVPEL